MFLVDITHNIKDQKFSTKIDNDEAYLKYQILQNGNLDFISTFVPPSGRGMGIAKKLVDSGIAFAKEMNCKIVPSCSYVESYLNSDKNLMLLKA
jgi:uncharacterized protein